MSYVLDGKIANQDPIIRISGTINCGKCSKLIPLPQRVIIDSKHTKQVFECASYIGTEHFIYETKSGTAVVYCSEYCRNKHNHRFSK